MKFLEAFMLLCLVVSRSISENIDDSENLANFIRNHNKDKSKTYKVAERRSADYQVVGSSSSWTRLDDSSRMIFEVSKASNLTFPLFQLLAIP
jgi:hypothetical protein